MSKLHVTPVHPGEILLDELEEIGLTQTALAKHMRVSPNTINKICRGKGGIGVEMAGKLQLPGNGPSLSVPGPRVFQRTDKLT